MNWFKKKVAPEPKEPTPQTTIAEPDRADVIADCLDKVYQGNTKGMTGTQDSIGFNQFGQVSDVVSTNVLTWFANQSFIGWGAITTLSQNWLIGRACSVPVEDAIKNGWDIVGNDGNEIPPDVIARLKRIDEKHDIVKKAISYGSFARVFGYRVAIFQCENWTQEDYAAPFNPDGVTPENRYTGIITPDPYYATPIVEDFKPDDQTFFEPEYWVVNGIKYHRTHCIIYRHRELPQVLRPVYMYGGVSLTQEIYEAIYAYGLGMDELNKLLMTKRLIVMHGDVESAITDQYAFEQKMNFFRRARDNHGVQILGNDDTMEQLDTSLTEVPDVIDKFIERISAIAKTPPNRLMGTQLKGFGSSGEAEDKIYHDNISGLQTHCLKPLITRHTLLTMRSIGLDIGFEVAFNPAGTPTEAEIADINSKNAATGQVLVTSGAITADEERARLITDKNSGYNGLDAEIEQPENFDDDNEPEDNAEEITPDENAPEVAE